MLCVVLPILRVSAAFQGPKLPRKEVEPQLCPLGILDKMQTLTWEVGWGGPRFCIYHKPPGETGAVQQRATPEAAGWGGAPWSHTSDLQCSSEP